VPLALVAAPEADVIEIDEICLRQSPPLWLWIAVSRLVGQVLGFALGDRTDAMLTLCWSDVPADYQVKPVRTDHWGAYARFFAAFAAGQHQACDKGSGETSHAEAWNTKWRQRQSGRVRRSCGVSERIADDLVERYLILVGQHNQQCATCWNIQQQQANLTTP
jgi:IS1 family transposase